MTILFRLVIGACLTVGIICFIITTILTGISQHEL